MGSLLICLPRGGTNFVPGGGTICTVFGVAAGTKVRSYGIFTNDREIIPKEKASSCFYRIWKRIGGAEVQIHSFKT